MNEDDLILFHSEIQTLREIIYQFMVQAEEDKRTIDILVAERDKARRTCCEHLASEDGQTPQDVASVMKWDCFEADTNNHEFRTTDMG